MASEIILALGDNNFNQVINETNMPFLVDFWAAWCGPCKMIAPIVEEVATEFKDKVKVGKLNVDENQGVPGSLKVSSIPTLIIFKEGKEVERSVGYKSKDEILRWLTKHL
ncbi:thioredoxin [Pelotomaculum terephthalicicum JT]|uniref:thioredoxin n=1 Tax=Pelotomaculum TaxID=191373 RepID=UPI0009CEAE54|nr:MULTISPECIES: thioredoxin [Pelotomaculum]MCG9967245.1 thioredoxin [Pelotomaculum terephthalicicum JT]OPX88654.1 MAG: Thioredoxin [Pelotomaculum sp. PtaB.Bin117]OPY63570.1 MAG: Thioredoxin [Pelotomaculum sp. PtaU1.Bin065]